MIAVQSYGSINQPMNRLQYSGLHHINKGEIIVCAIQSVFILS